MIVTDLVVKRGKKYICYYLHAGEDRLGDIKLCNILGSFRWLCLLRTGYEHFACQDTGLTQIFKLIVSSGEKELNNKMW